MQAQGFSMTIGGASVLTDQRLEVLNPANEQIVGYAPDCSRAQLDQAVSAARQAFGAWKRTSIEERRQALRSISAVLTGHADELKGLLTAEQGKPHGDAAGDIAAGAYWCEGTANLDLSNVVLEDTDKSLCEARRVPLGVVGAIAPWNFPVALAMFKVAPALLTGNTVVLKPSPFTPLTTLRIGELLRGILPAGVLNVISGGDELGPWMTSHPRIDKISFTGSTQTGRNVMQSAAAGLKRVTLELGGNDAAIVLPDVDVAEVAEQLFWAAFRNTGQICVATKRLYIHEAIYNEMREALVAQAKATKVGDGAQQGVEIGPIQNRQQHERVRELIRDCQERGYRLLAPGNQPQGPGYFLPVTLVDNPPDNARIVREEQFGPVLPLLRFRDIDEVVERANDSTYGLGASVWSADEERAKAIAERLNAGTVWVNESQRLSPLAPFGGQGQSGVGVEGGVEGLLQYTNPQTIFIRRAQS